MDISDIYKKQIINELTFIVRKIEESRDIEEALYYYSGVRALIQRIFNFEYNPHLVFIHLVLNNTFNTIAGFMDQIKKRTTIIPFNIEFFRKLAELLKSLILCIEKEEFTYEVLEKLSVLAYSITGNGYYLQQKGIELIDF